MNNSNRKIYKEYEDLSKVKTIYYLYLSSMFTFYISTLIGYAMAFGERKNPNNSIIVDSHFNYIIKILNINVILNLIILLGGCAYGFMELSQIDFMNLEVEELVTKTISLVSAWGVFSIIITIIFYIQTFIGIKKANNEEQI